MTNKIDLDENGIGKSALREAAEDKLGRSPDTTLELKDKTPEEIIHELHVHQIELEMQNEELKRSQLALKKSRDEFRDLYDFSPVGYFTLTHRGVITQANLTGAALLRMPRSALIGRGFGHFVAPESLDQWDEHIITVMRHEEKQSCVLSLECEDGSSFYALLESIRMDVPAETEGENNGGHVIRTAMSDITERKRMEDTLRSKTQQLNERVKALNCLYSISRIVEKSDITLNQILQGIVDIIPPSWQYPENACASVILLGREFKTRTTGRRSRSNLVTLL